MTKMPTSVLWAFACLVILAASCKKEVTADFHEPDVPKDIPLFNNASQIDRVQKANEILIWQSDGLKDSLRTSQIDDRDGEANPNDDIFWLHVADVLPLVYQGELLSATHVAVKNNYAFVSYHLRGEAHKGAIEVVDLTDPENPVVVGQSFFNNADVNAIEVDETSSGSEIRVWVALSDFKKGAVLGELVTQNGSFSENQYAEVNLSNFIESGVTSSANSIKHAGDYLYVTSGKSKGGIFKINVNDLQVEGVTEFPEAKYVTTNGSLEDISTVVTLQAGTTSLLRTDVVGNHKFSAAAQIGAIEHQNVDAANSGKSTIHFESPGSDRLYVAMGTSGLKAFNTANGLSEIWAAPSNMLTAGNCNGISSDHEFLYAANGADGLAVFQLLENEDPNLVFTWDLEDQVASANFVLASDDFVFVAKGQGGLKILKRPGAGDLLPLSDYDGNGTPKNLSADLPVCGELLSNLFTDALPEQVDATVAHPEFFNQNVVENLYLSQGADVYLTFLHEGAGYKNTLGYYYYDADNPPASEEDLVKIIVFPNASASGSGGDLKPGNTMELLGSFSENTVIGFFLIADGWQNGLTEGLGFLFSDPQFNDGKVQSLIFYDQECDASVIAFEDIDIANGGCDKDYNDAVFMITTTPQAAVDVSTFLQLED